MYCHTFFSLIVLLLSSFCLPSAGQIIVIDEHDKVRKKEILDFLNEQAESAHSTYRDYYNTRNKVYSKLIKKRRNKLTVSGDTCSFYIAKDRYTIRCMGGVDEMQKYDTDEFRI